METLHTAAAYNEWHTRLGCANKSVGFVPTMGALHDGHLSLIRASKRDNDYTVCSIFVNPTQFNEKEDYEKYPRLMEEDAAKLEGERCDVLFAPDTEEMYPASQGVPQGSSLNLGILEEVMEGKYRPGHFKGVVSIVERFFRALKPDRAYFGQKDYQQLAVIRMMREALQLPVEITACPTVREKDGLAMSSRNLLLSDKQRAEAAAIYRSLLNCHSQFRRLEPRQIIKIVEDEINSHACLKAEYVEIANPDSLQPLDTLESTDSAVCCVAVRAGDIRLIDNIMLHD